MADDEPRPDWWRHIALDPRVLRSNAWHSQIECQCCSQRFAEGRNDYVHARKRDHPRQTEAYGSRLRLLRRHSTAEGKLAGGNGSVVGHLLVRLSAVA